MYSFDGRPKPSSKVSLGGMSKQLDRSSILEIARAERQKRETTRQQHVCSIRIQAWYRGCSTRRLQANVARHHFDGALKRMQAGPDFITGQDILTAVQMINFFFDSKTDYSRLVSVCQILLKLSSQKKLESVITNSESRWLQNLKKLLLQCCRSLDSSGDPQLNISIPLRMLEVFTSRHTFFWLGDKSSEVVASISVFILKQGFFRYLRVLAENRIPGGLDEPCNRPPTPLAAAIKDLLANILTLVSVHFVDANMKVTCITKFVEDLMCSDVSEQLCYFVLPAIAEFVPLNLLTSAILANYSTLQSKLSVWTLHSFLLIGQGSVGSLALSELVDFVSVLKLLVRSLSPKKEVSSSLTPAQSGFVSDDSDEEERSPSMEVETITKSNDGLLTHCNERSLEELNDKKLIKQILLALDRNNDHKLPSSSLQHFVLSLCEISFHLLVVLKVPVHKARFLYSLAFDLNFVREAWQLLVSSSTVTSAGKEVYLIQRLSSGIMPSITDQQLIIPVLGAFASLFRYSLFSVYDADFYGEKAGTQSSLMPFTLLQLVQMSKLLIDVVLGLIELMHPDTKAAQQPSLSISTIGGVRGSSQYMWMTLCQLVTQLVRQLYSRDSRHPFCPEGHWLSSRVAINQEAVNIGQFVEDDGTAENKAFLQSLSTINARSLAALKYIPFSIPFLQRVRIFQRILDQDKLGTQGEFQHVALAHSLNISVNRKYLYQDAYDQLSHEREPDIKRIVRVKMINAQGLDEAGIDGGGVFREFLSQLIWTGFDPSYGFFKLTSQQLLYPNPEVERISPDYLKHFHFLGRMLGKAIYEHMMVELPLADFFLCKLLNKQGADLDIHHLESMDPELHKNLLYLKNYDGDVDDLSLNFTVMNSDLGETTVEELKPGGKDVGVTQANKIEYIHLMADYRLNKRIRPHCNAFRAGLSDVINIEWLQMFDHRELQTLISGARIAIDVDDLRANTNYSGLYSADDPYMEEFWKILYALTDKQKRQFLKFVTSCSRPPLLGFSHLYPKFCIHYGGEEDRLPTASTCMNFLKLPRYSSPELLRTRLVYAIEAEAGFELS